LIRLSSLLLTIAALLLSICVSASASQTLSLSLETPGLDANTGKSASTEAKAKPAPKPKPKANTVRVGRVGVVQVATTGIYKSKSFKSGKYATVKAQTPLAVVKEEGEWLGILMQNGATGWVARGSVKMTGYELVASKPIDRGVLVSRGGMDDRSGGPGDAIVRYAMQYSGGVRYVYGGNSPSSGMDCSAFLKMVFGQYGVNLPRTAREQAQVGMPVAFDQLQPGDRLYFSCKNSYVDHCGIYAGSGYFVHCSASHNGVALDCLTSDFYWRSLVAARRS